MAPTAIPIDDSSSAPSTPATETPLDQGLATGMTSPIAPSPGDALNGLNANGNGTANGSNGYFNGRANGSANGHATNGTTPTNGTTNNGSFPAISTSTKFAPVAIIGMSCRLPGGVSDAEEFYELCCRARSGWSEVPASRFSKAGYHHPNPDKLGCFNPVGGCWLTEDVSAFDAPFFNITEREAISMDPQHRLILECTYEALENAGIPRHQIVGKNVGVFAGGSFTDYELNNLRDLDTAPMYQSTGNAPSLMSNRLSYYFDLRGPSHTVETACSSSLTALHLAMQSLHVGDSSMVVLASSHLNLLPDHFVSMSSQGLLSGDGRSYAFDSRANGFGRGEGAGVVILKPLDAALRDNDAIRAVVVGTGVNQDGRTNGITMPNGDAQLDLMQQVYTNSGLNPADCGYVEAHGTGTKVGDPIEMTALHKMFHKGRSVRQPLYVGSVKTNVGHLEGASGIVSLIKSAMMLQRGYILPNHDFRTGNPEIPFTKWGIKIPIKQIPWPKSKKYISVNSFGFGGGNAHAVLEAPPKRLNIPVNWSGNEAIEPRRIFVVSAHSKESLTAQLQNITVYLERHPVAFQSNVMANLAYTLGQRRSFLPYKAAITANDGAGLTSAFALAQASQFRSTKEPNIGFVFTGQGAQWHAMGRELASSYPIFRASLEKFDACLSRLGAKFSLLEELLERDAKTSRLGDAELSQPSCTAIQLALTDLLSAWGVRPRAVVGHSSGEIGAAYAAGALTLEECASVAYFRGQAVLELKSSRPGLKGGMLAVGSSPEDALPLIKTLRNGKATVACVNSPGSITASGDEEAINELQAKIEEKGWFNRRVRVDTAYHSHHMEMVADWYGDSVGQLKPTVAVSSPEKPSVAFFSSLKGHLLDSTAELTTSYWVRNLTQPVQFASALAEMCTPVEGREKIDVLVEIGPHSALAGPVKQILKGVAASAPASSTASKKQPIYFSSLIRDKDAVESTLDLAGSLFIQGSMINFEAVNFPVPPPRPLEVLTDMPHYPWDHSRKYWWETRISKAHLHRQFPRNDVLGALADYSNELEPTWRNVIRADELPWVRGHMMQDMIIYPMAGYLSMAVEAAAQRATLGGKPFDRFVFRDVTISRPLVIQEGTDAEVNITLRPYAEGTKQSSKAWDEFRVFSWSRDRSWIEHCRGLIRVESKVDAKNNTTSNPVHDAHVDDQALLSELKSRVASGCTAAVNASDIYQDLEGVTAKYGAQFKSMENCTAGDSPTANQSFCVADIVVPDTAKIMPKNHETSLYVHPAFLDQFTHAAWVILGAGRGRLPALYMPRFLKGLSISASVCRNPGDRLKVYGIGNPDFSNPGPTEVTMIAMGPDSDEEMIRMDSLVVDPFLEGGALSDKPAVRGLCYKVDWEAIPEEETPEGELTDGITIICSPAQQDTLAAELKKQLASTSKSDITISSLETAPLDGRLCIVVSELDEPVLANLTPETFARVQKLAQSAKAILWVVRGAYSSCSDPRQGMILGLARTVRSESSLRFGTLDLDATVPLNPISASETIISVARRVLSKGASSQDMEFQQRNNTLSVCRVDDDVPLDTFISQQTNPTSGPFEQPFAQPGRALKLTVGTKGALDTLHFIDDANATKPLGADEISIQVQTTSMNFKDIMVSMGEVPSPYLGVECSGVIAAVGSGVTHLKIGDRVCASSEGAYSTFTRCKATSAVRVPDNMSLEEAATVPVAFATAYYSLFDIGRLQRGESVLIHAAAGGVGQAAVMLCQMVGAELYATVGSTAKKTFLMETYGVPESHIFFSRDTTFGSALMRATDGRGVDLVLNSLAGDSLRTTWECIAAFGRFVEIGKRDILANTGLGMAVFERNATFASVDLTAVAKDRPAVMRRVLEDVFRLMEYGQIRPVSPVTTFSISEVEAAFRTLQAGKVHGKILVTAREGDMVKATYSDKTFSTILRPDATYIIVGGTGGIGRSMTRWMVSHGARHIVLVSRSDSISDKVAEVIRDAGAAGATVVVRKCDVSEAAEVDRMVKGLQAEMPPIRGLVHSAMVLDDVLFEKMTYPQWTSVTKSKVSGSWNLHNSLSSPGSTPLDFFIMLSSVAGIIGNHGQAAYAAANTYLDSLVQHRRSLGLAGTSLSLAAVSDTGYLAENADRRKQVLDQIGGEAISEAEILALIAGSITGLTEETCASHVVTGLKLPTSTSSLPFWATDGKFAPLVAARESAEPGADSGAQTTSPGAALKRATSAEEARQIVVEALMDKTAAVLMLPREELEAGRDMVSYGLDSLVSIEIRNWITRELGAALQILDLLSSGSFVSIADMIVKKTELVSFEK